MEKSIYTRDGKPIAISLPPPANIGSFFVFSLHKSGSVLLDLILREIFSDLSISMFSLESVLFEQGYACSSVILEKKDVDDIFGTRGYCFHGFRSLPNFLSNDFPLGQFKKILLIRDPRDIIVSYYFSMRESHLIPEGEAGNHLLEKRQQAQDADINSYVIQEAPFVKSVFQTYSKIEDDLLKLFRYEDVIFNKYQWIRDILDFLGLKLEEHRIAEIANNHDVFPIQEDSSSHIRRVTPGDHIQKLNPDTIKYLNNYFEDILIKYGYDFDGRAVERQALEVYFKQSQKRIHVLENQLKQSQFEAEQSQRQLKETQSALEQTQEQFQAVQLELEQTQEQFQAVQLELERSQNRVKHLRVKIQHLQARVSKLKTRLHNVRMEFASIQASKFWFVWSVGLKLKRWLTLKY